MSKTIEEIVEEILCCTLSESACRFEIQRARTDLLTLFKEVIGEKEELPTGVLEMNHRIKHFVEVKNKVIDDQLQRLSERSGKEKG